MSEQTALYRLFGGDGTLLYVGISKNFGQRWEQHAKAQPWWPEVRRQVIDWHPTWKAAEDAERLAIRTERPKYNKRAMRAPAPDPARPLAAAAVPQAEPVRISVSRIDVWDAACLIPEVTGYEEYWFFTCPLCHREHWELAGTEVHPFTCRPESARQFALIQPSPEERKRLRRSPDTAMANRA